MIRKGGTRLKERGTMSKKRERDGWRIPSEAVSRQLNCTTCITTDNQETNGSAMPNFRVVEERGVIEERIVTKSKKTVV